MKYKLKIKLIVLAAALFLSFASSASESIKTSNLEVKGMVSAACPVILRSAVESIDGVSKVEANLEKHSATIEYDDEKTSLATIQNAIKRKAGFDTRVK